MIRPRHLSRALCFGWVALLATARAGAGAPDARVVQTRLEDQLIEGEIDAEDFVAWHRAPGSLLGTGRGAAYLGLETFVVEKVGGATEMGALVVLELPLERFAQRRPRLVTLTIDPGASSALEGAGLAWLGDAHDELSRVNGAGAPVEEALSRLEVAETPAARGERSALPAVAITTDVARACVRATLRTMGLVDDNRLDSVAARARSSAALPELRFRAARTLGESGRVSLSEDDPSRYVASGVATNVLEARLTFRLDRLLFADEEIAVERARLDRSELRSRAAAKALQALFEWQRAYALMQDVALAAEDRLAAALREAEASAILDMMTGGWFGGFRAALAAARP
jgi:hypothetical protein